MYIPEWNITNLAVTTVSSVGICFLVARELFPATRLNYSKFNDASKSDQISISSYNGMLLIYSPSLVLGALFTILSGSNYRMLLISATIFGHYLKRVLEVMYVHRYSDESKLRDSLLISLAYSSFSVFVYKLSSIIPTPNLSETLLGLVLFLVGEFINFYHHLILRDLRKDGSKAYKIPSGGLFDYVWCPHYLGEIITFIGITFLSQHIMILILQSGSGAYLATRAYNTKKWYSEKFDTVPFRACLVPYIF